MNLKPAILYADEHLLVVNKPAGLLSLPDGYDPDKPYLQSVLEPEWGRLWMIHRLDRLASGVLVLARNADAHRDLNGQFARRQVTKIYHALVSDQPEWETNTVTLPLRANVGRRNRTAVDHRRGKSASTRLRVLETFKQHALVEARPSTGRRHQIRAHLYARGHPILSDPLYGSGETSPLIDRLALHARALQFTHPETEESVSFEAPYPADFSTALRKLDVK
jgi:RluA family pseudouridine synthase